MRIPSAGTPIKMKDLMRAYNCFWDFEEELRRMLGVRYCFAVNSGTTAFYIILNALKASSNKKEILLPAYTAPSLILPIRKAGLKYKLVDISAKTFNMDIEKISASISNDTLAILFIHMFGIPIDIEKARDGRDVCIIEDAASSFGTRKGSRFTGTFGDIGFISFNRGKNLSTVAGGMITTDDDTLARLVREEREKLPFPSLLTKAKISFKALALSFVVRPWVYTIFRHGISTLKDTTLHQDFDSFRYTAFQGSLGCSLLKRSDGIFSGRERKGMMLYHALKHLSGIRLPAIPEGWNIAFNQFPLVVEDVKKRNSVLEAVIKAGVEATILYEKPIHRIYDDFNPADHEEYPNAEYLAGRLLLIPVHHYVSIRNLNKVIEAIEKAFRS